MLVSGVMSDSPAEILLHPVRLRIVLAFGSEELTTAQIAARLPDIAHATLYRQVATLSDAGILHVVRERRVRGGIERTYALVSDAVTLGPDSAGSMSNEELQRGFGVFIGALMESFGRYLDHPSANLAKDPVAFRQAAIWLDESELAELAERLRSALAPYLDNEPSEDRERLLVNTILIPDREARSGCEADPGGVSSGPDAVGHKARTAKRDRDGGH
jgi:DNA-binding transcriptional ArsR family regulator